MQKPFGRNIGRVTLGSGDHGGTRGRRQASAAGVAGADAFAFNAASPADRVLDGAVAGAAAQVAFQRVRQILPLRLVQRSRGHDHSRGAEAALKSLCIQKCLLHGVQRVAGCKPFDGRDVAIVRPIGRNDATVHRLAVEHDGAGAAVARVTAFLDADVSELPKECPQALSRRWARHMQTGR